MRLDSPETVLLRGLSLLFTLLALATPAGLVASERPDIVGRAMDPESGDTLYLEHYYCSADDLVCKVLYLQPDRALIARKDINYRSSRKAPELTFRDFRTEQKLSVSRPGEDLVIDAGFDNFVRSQWQVLDAGQEITFPFLLVDRDKPLNMRARKDASCDASQLCLEVRIDSWLLGFIVDPIKLTYERESQRLMRFQGISNLQTDSGRSQKVVIRYTYRVEAPPEYPEEA